MAVYISRLNVMVEDIVAVYISRFNVMSRNL